MTSELLPLFIRDLEKLAKEINNYQNESDLWVVSKEVNNSAGNLAKHLTGNLRHFIGHLLGGSAYVRDRKAEFETKDEPVAALLTEIELAKADLDTDTLANSYPINVLGYDMTIQYFLMHLYGHFNYHLGQISYHRRLLDRAV
jgi:uncharacterized damage-inducible protein DinB